MMRVVAMPKSVHITAPWPTPEEMEKSLGISKASSESDTRRWPRSLRLNSFPAGRESPTSTVAEPEKRRKRASAA